MDRRAAGTIHHPAGRGRIKRSAPKKSTLHEVRQARRTDPASLDSYVRDAVSPVSSGAWPPRDLSETLSTARCRCRDQCRFGNGAPRDLFAPLRPNALALALPPFSHHDGGSDHGHLRVLFLRSFGHGGRITHDLPVVGA
jgi:hypothetical protein